VERNPFEAPHTPDDDLEALLGREGVPPDAEDIRRRHLTFETNLRQLGALWVVGGVFATLGGLAMPAILIGEGQGDALPLALGVGGLYLALGLGQLFAGLQLRKLSPRARLPGTLVTLPGLIAIPVGTMFSGLILYGLHSSKGQYILSEPYRRIVDATPHVRPKTPVFVWVLLGLIVALVVFGLVAAVAGA
jgi:hypothetical protein